MKRTILFICLAFIVFAVIMLGINANKDTRGDASSQFKKDFGLDIDKNSIKTEELFNNYSGPPYEGVAMYRITVDQKSEREFRKWKKLPLSAKADRFLTSVSPYVRIPEISHGYWKLIDRNPGTKEYTNVSFAVYDADEKLAYMITMDS